MIFVGDVGAVFTISTNYNLTGYTAAAIYWIDPTGVIVSKTPTITTPSSGIMSYTTTSESELYMSGVWQIQVVVWFGANKPMYSDTDKFSVMVPPANPTGTPI